MKDGLIQTGYCVIDNFLPPEQCEYLLELIDNYRTNHRVTEVIRNKSRNQERSLHYWVIDGSQIKTHLPEIWNLHHNVNDVVNNLSKKELTNLENEKVTVNINIMKTASEYRWHYDRNKITAILYLNKVKGGNTEFYPNYRLHLGKNKQTKLQNILDLLLQINILRRFFSKKHLVEPRQGRILIMQADKCLHSVSSVEGGQERINIIMAYDYPGTKFSVEKNLDSYLYTQQESGQKDPNYLISV
jgi:hypothetical protein